MVVARDDVYVEVLRTKVSTVCCPGFGSPFLIVARLTADGCRCMPTVVAAPTQQPALARSVVTLTHRWL